MILRSNEDKALEIGAFYRHCAVCFTLIEDEALSKGSMEGRYYCSTCGRGLFRNGLLDSLKRGEYQPEIPDLTQF